METVLLDEFSAKAVGGRYSKYNTVFQLALEGGLTVKIRPSNFDACYALFDVLLLGDDAKNLAQYQKDFNSNLFDKEELRSKREELTNVNEEILSHIERDDVTGEVFFAGNFQGTFEDIDRDSGDKKKVVRTWTGLVA